MIAEWDKVVWRWTFQGRHTSPFMGIPETGKQITMTGIVIDRFSNGQIVERYDRADTLCMMQQLGVIPPPA